MLISRTVKIIRNTNETQISIFINLNGIGQQILNTNIPFF